jgi:hypothetical protein
MNMKLKAGGRFFQDFLVGQELNFALKLASKKMCDF